jgi:fatty acid desaturase
MQNQDAEPISSISKDFYQLRSSIWLADLVLDWAVIVLVFWIFSWFKNVYLVPIASLLIGARMHALGLLAHEVTHRNAFKNQVLNDLAQIVTAWPLLVTLENGYRPWHFEHHRLLGTAKDSELISYRAKPPYNEPANWKKILFFFFIDLFGLGIFSQFKFFSAIFPTKKYFFLGPLILWSGFFIITQHYESSWIFWLYFWSLISGFWAVFRVRTWTEHVGVEFNGKETSHRFSTGRVSRFLFFPHNTFCHYEHHKWPQVPYYNLPKLRALDHTKKILFLKDFL